MKEKIPFNVPHLTGKEIGNIEEAVRNRVLSGNGVFTKKCHTLLKRIIGSEKVLLTTSCTDALEMCAILLDISPGDEVIMPSYTFVSTANAFVLRGANVRFVDSRIDHPGMDEMQLESLITERTKAIVPVHYAGVACDMDLILDIATKHEIGVVEDAAQAIDSKYKGEPLGSFGDLGAFSFHETKNLIAGEGGLLTVNNQSLADRSEIVWEKGTNRAAFWRGEVDKYGWVDVGSSFLASDITAAFLYAQLVDLEDIQVKRIHIWTQYMEGLKDLVQFGVGIPVIPVYASNNAHMFYLITRSLSERTNLIRHLKSENIDGLFHYLSLHKSPYFINQHDGRSLAESDRYSDQLVRLPLYYDMSEDNVQRVIDAVWVFYK